MTDDERAARPRLERIGTIAHVWRKAGAAEVELDGHGLRVGDLVLIRRGGRGFVQEVFTLEVDRVAREAAGPGEPVIMGVMAPVRERDEVFRVPRGAALDDLMRAPGAANVFGRGPRGGA